MGRTWIHQHLWASNTLQNARIVMAEAIHSRVGLRAQNFVAGRCLMVQNTENDPDSGLGCSKDLKIQAYYFIRPLH
jgi:hypothetical protein